LWELDSWLPVSLCIGIIRPEIVRRSSLVDL
jgi:hypothetical protein